MLIYIFDDINKKPSTKDNQWSTANQDNILKEIETAKKEWENALKRFNDVSDPEVVDYIVYYILAAERRYMYLLNKYKAMKVNEKKQSTTQELVMDERKDSDFNNDF